MTFDDWNLFDDTEAWREVTLGTKEERKAKMQDPEMRRRLKEEWDAGIRPTTVVAGSVGSLIVQTKNVKIDIGAEAAFPTLPAPVEVGGAAYFLIKTRDGYKLLSRVCPHQGGTVEDEGGGQFVCHNHGYQYDKDGGKCLNADGLRMKSYVVNVKEGRLIALLPDAKSRQLGIGRANRPADRRCARQARDRCAARHGGRGRSGHGIFRPDPGRETRPSLRPRSSIPTSSWPGSRMAAPMSSS